MPDGAAPAARPAASAAVTMMPPGLPPPLVCMLSAAHPPADVRVVGKEGATLVSAGWRVRHICPAAAGAVGGEARHGVAIAPYRRAAGWLGRLRNIPALARRAADSGAAVLHASEPDAWLAAILAARRNGARVVLDVHEHYPSRLDHRLPRLLRPLLAPLARAAIRGACRAMARRADAVVVAKDGLDGDFAAPERIVPVRNYARASQVTPRRHRAGPLTLVHLGALGRARGAMEMLDCLAFCPASTRLTLVGRFTDGSESAFAGRAERLELAARVTRRGWLPHGEALAEAARCDIGLVLFQPGVENHRLALPHKLFDCMLAGLPVIAPAFATEVAQVVREAECGLLVDTADPEAIAAAVRRLADPGLRAGMGARGREAALGRFGWAGEAERLVRLYHRLAPLPR
ncbi:glycosyltransferase [Roseomonas sp. KE0001]|uniref:glycosyltransferase n=1 Tax=unclassified Roseomonas TaxID=2617492 RepID=UPI0018DF257C|nr:glycosyltransferase [Roseomonas sp. KE0001]MBI0434875.1 glycosyltransferase [Roseomonas sp. KE0001]